MTTTTHDFLAVEATALQEFGIPVDLSEELVPCMVQTTMKNGKLFRLHLTNLTGSFHESTSANVIFADGKFLRLMLQRHSPKPFKFVPLATK